jgi:exosome complex component RRP46
MALSQHPRSLVQLVIQSLSSPATSYHTTTEDSTEGPVSHTWPPASSVSTRESAAPTPSGYLAFAERATALNAATLAVLDAGAVSLRAVPLAVALAYAPAEMYVDVTGDMGSDGEGRQVHLVVDPTADEEASAKSRFVFGWAFGEGVSTSGPRAKAEDADMLGGADETLEAELVWVESEGSFSKAEVSDLGC